MAYLQNGDTRVSNDETRGAKMVQMGQLDPSLPYVKAETLNKEFDSIVQ